MALRVRKKRLRCSEQGCAVNRIAFPLRFECACRPHAEKRRSAAQRQNEAKILHGQSPRARLLSRLKITGSDRRCQPAEGGNLVACRGKAAALGFAFGQVLDPKEGFPFPSNQT